MQFVAPVKFEDAVNKLGSKSPIGAQLKSAQWAAVPVGLRERAFFSSTIESVKFLGDLHTGLKDFLEGNRETVTRPDGQTDTVLKVGSRAKFIENMRRKAIAQGLGPIDPEDAGTIKDIRSEKRLGLIFDIQTKAAKSFGDRKQGMDADVLQEFPGVRFIRIADVQQERAAHTPFEGHVFLKTDLKMFARINQDFGGVPWAPFGWGCMHDVEDVDRDTTDTLGLTHPGETVPGAGDEDFNKNLKASVRDLSPEMVDFLKRQFGDQVSFENGEARWIPRKPETTPEPEPIAPSANPDASDPAPRAWRDQMESIAQEYKSAAPAAKDALIERARTAVEIPEASRMGVSIENKASRAVAQVARAGNDVIARFVRPSLTRNVNVSLHQTHDDRAYHRAGGVYLNVHSDRSTAAHEIAHAVELQNPSVLRAAAEFLLRRGKGEAPEKLSKLTGNKGYWSTEIALEDDWVERGGRVYAGKVYSSHPNPTRSDELRATEVITMGIERLLADPIDFYARDPDWFNFMIETVGIGASDVGSMDLQLRNAFVTPLFK